MSRIAVDPGQVTATGEALSRLAPTATQVGWSIRAVAGKAEAPPATSAALEGFASAWSAGAQRLDDELISLGEAAQGAGFLYTLTDQTAIPFSAP